MDKYSVMFILPSLRRAGAETQMVDLINALDRRRWSITVVVFMDDLSLLERLNTDSIDFQLIPRGSKFSTNYIRKIRSLIRAKGVGLVHCTLQFSLLVATIACMGLGQKDRPRLIAAIHTTKNVDLKNELADKLIYSHCLRLAHHIIFVCEAQRDYWIQRFSWIGRKSTVVHNGVDTTYFDPFDHEVEHSRIASDLGLSDEDKIILCIAGFRAEKGHDKLLRVFSRLSASSNPLLILGGDGPTRSAMEAYSKELKVADRVFFLGNLPDVRPYIGISDLTVLASTAVETFSIAMLESLSMGKPVVAPNIGGLHEAIALQPENGSLFELGSETEMLQVLQDWLEKSSRKPCRPVRDCVEQNFSVPAMASRVEMLLLEACTAHRKFT